MLDIQNLSISFSQYAQGLKRRTTCAIRSLDLAVKSGEVVAIVGQSGAGKSLLAHAVLGILPRNASQSGSIRFKGEELTPARARRLRGREIALIPQGVSYLNPLLSVGVQVARAGELGGLNKKQAKHATRKALQRYGLAEETIRSFPFQLSGGMARRVLTSTATIGGADLLLADEPTNGLDHRSAGESLRHLRELADSGKAVVLITHDIHLALPVADRISVFCGGLTIEEAQAEDFNGDDVLRHPYSRDLWNSVPANAFTAALPPVVKGRLNGGCPYSDRCLHPDEMCLHQVPEIKSVSGGRVRCWHA